MTEQTKNEIIKLLNMILKSDKGFITLDQLNEVLSEKGYEVSSNKVTVIDSNSTDDQYPSAKTVFDLGEEWEFTLSDNTTVTKIVLCLTSQP